MRADGDAGVIGSNNGPTLRMMGSVAVTIRQKRNRLKGSLLSDGVKCYAAAAATILLWATHAALVSSLSHVPPFLLTGLALVFGGLPAVPKWRNWSSSPLVYCVGVYGLFFYHVLYFLALRTAPAVEANLVQYLWPFFVVILTPLFFKNTSIKISHLAGVLAGFGGCALVVLTSEMALDSEFHVGYAYALGSAMVWATYSLSIKKMPPQTTYTLGGTCLISGLLSLGVHAFFEPAVSLTLKDLGVIGLQGIGPMGIAFHLWSYSLQRGDARTISILAYAIPVLSTFFLIGTTNR